MAMNRVKRGLLGAVSVGLLVGLAQGAQAQGLAQTPRPSTPVAAAVPVAFTVYLPLQNRAQLVQLTAAQTNPASGSYHKWLTPAQFNTQFGPSPDAVAQVTSTLKAQGFAIGLVQGRAITASGTAAGVARAFATVLTSTVGGDGLSHITAQGGLKLPASLKTLGAVIPAFSGPPRLHVHSAKVSVAAANPNNRYSPVGGYWFTDLKQAYDYPSYQTLDGTGVSVAVLMANDIKDSDVQAMFDHEKFTAVTGKPAPTVTHVYVDGGAPFDADGSTEASLDVQQVLGGAPGAQVTLVDVPDLSDQSTTDGYNYIVNAADARGFARYQVVSSSFGGCESFYSAAYNGGQDFGYLLDGVDDLFLQGNSEGISFVASSGDAGGLGCPDPNYFNRPQSAPSRFLPGVEFPASSPHVTAVGGTNLITSYSPTSLSSSYAMENAQGDPVLPFDPYGVGVDVSGGFWGAGGGTSYHFAKPDYQTLVATGSQFRTVPDVGMQVGGCPLDAISPCGPNRSYVFVIVGGNLGGVIGTSVAAPEFAGALALVVQHAGGAVGGVNSFLYAQAAAQTAGTASGYHRAIPGFDGKYGNSVPGPNYNYLVGNGTPKIRSLFGLTALAPAGDPKSASNP